MVRDGIIGYVLDYSPQLGNPNLFFPIFVIVLSILSFNYGDNVKAHRKIAPFTSRIIARALVEADRRMEHHRRFIKTMEDARTLSIKRFNTLPGDATIRKEYVKCGKDSCEMLHGPYYYAYWKERISSSDDNQSATVWKLKKKYIGSYLPEAGRG